MISGEDGSFIDWKGQLPQKGQTQIETILEKGVSNNTRDKEYFQYLQVKWKDKPSEDAVWMTTKDISKYNVHPEDLLKNYFLPPEYDAGASRQSPMFVE